MRSLGVLPALVSLSCLITELPGDPPVTTASRPVILHDQAQPPITRVITRIEGTRLEVPVEADPRLVLRWELFVDFDPQTNPIPVVSPDEQPLEPDTITLKPTRTIVQPLEGLNIDRSRCHQLTLIVAFDFDRKSQWTPKPPGGDMIVWFYRPNGNEAACPQPDAGTFPDVMVPPDAGAE
jgi:hypothetical protein